MTSFDIMDYTNEKTHVDVPDGVVSIDIQVAYGDEIAVMRFGNGQRMYVDSCPGGRRYSGTDYEYPLWSPDDEDSLINNVAWQNRHDSDAGVSLAYKLGKCGDD